MPKATYLGRRAVRLEGDDLRVTLLEEGGHIAEVFDRRTGVSPLWTPPWATIEPSAYDPAIHREYGSGSDAKLLAGIMGHNLCLDIFGAPSEEEAASGMTPHGDASVVGYEMASTGAAATMRARLPLAELEIERRVELRGRTVLIREVVENLACFDRPIGWTEHVTLGPPFLQKGATQFHTSAAESRVFDGPFGVADYMRPGADFTWPLAPRADGRAADLRVFTAAGSSSAYTAHLMDAARTLAFFVAYSPASHLAFGYVWRRSDFPWMGIWEENRSRTESPWNGRTIARGMEFGVSPFPERRRDMVDRGRLFGVPTYRWLPARGRAEVEYCAVLREADRAPETLDWPL